MDTPSVLWTTWHEQLKELLTGMHGHQKKTLADLSYWASSYRVAQSCNEWPKPCMSAASVKPR